jgi:hypothetical protein
MLLQVSVKRPGVVVSMPLVTLDVASAGAALTNIPPRIAKAATTAAVRVLVINYDENIRNLKAA